MTGFPNTERHCRQAMSALWTAEGPRSSFVLVLTGQISNHDWASVPTELLVSLSRYNYVSTIKHMPLFYVSRCISNRMNTVQSSTLRKRLLLTEA